MTARFISSPRFASRGYGRNHPLAIPRVALAHRLAEACGLIAPGEYPGARRATEAALAAPPHPGFVPPVGPPRHPPAVAPAARARYRPGRRGAPLGADRFTPPGTPCRGPVGCPSGRA